MLRWQSNFDQGERSFLKEIIELLSDRVPLPTATHWNFLQLFLMRSQINIFLGDFPSVAGKISSFYHEHSFLIRWTQNETLRTIDEELRKENSETDVPNDPVRHP